MSNQPFDKYAGCPNCGHNLDGGDIYEVLSKLDIHINKSPAELIKLASNYGWTQVNEARFTNAIGIILGKSPEMPDDMGFYQCPSCKHVFSAMTGEESTTLVEAKFKLIHHGSGSDHTKLSDLP